MKTFSLLILFTVALGAAPPAKQLSEHAQARKWMAEAQKTSNPIRLFFLAQDIHKALDAALARDPNDVQVRLDLVRFHVMTPRIAGGDMDEAREQAEEIFHRDAPLGHFARGYIAYGDKAFGPARQELREAVKTARDPATKSLALRWLGWLSQESQQWDDAFAAFEELGDLYEIGRTSVFCRCRIEQGRAALRRLNTPEAKKLLSGLRQR